MINFGELEVVEKTFTREGGAVRTQAYNGIKFRRYESTKGKKAAEEAGEAFTPFVEEQFVISNKAWEQLGLENYALTQVKNGNQVMLLVLEDQDAVKPHAKFMRRSYSKSDNAPQKKGKMFSNEFLAGDLISAGILDSSKHGNQYLALQDVTSQVSGLPSHVKAVYNIIPDTTVSAEADAMETAASENEF
jgi:hypothetical protein